MAKRKDPTKKVTMQDVKVADKPDYVPDMTKAYSEIYEQKKGNKA